VTLRALLLGIVLAVSLPAHAQVTSFQDFRAAYVPSDVLLTDRHGRAIGAARIDMRVRRLGWVALEEVSPAFVEALLTAEDKRYFDHRGVDWVAAAAALWQQATSDSLRGASTISMQVAAFLDPRLLRSAGPRTWDRKWDQVEAALELEKHWTKAQILEAYLNTITFRGELQGLRAASQGLFQKAPSGLDRAESAVLAALVRAPGASPAWVARRACGILAHTRPGQPCEREALADLVRHARLAPEAAEPLAPHAARRLLAAGKPVRSTLDADLQRIARDAVQAQVAQLLSRGVEDGAAVVLDNPTGEVLAYVGSSGSFSRAPQVDAADAPRQAGSTLKPFLYGLAFQRQLLTPATLLDDSPIAVATDAGVYAPRNYDLRFLGPVSVRRALGSSLNVPAVRVIAMTGAPALHQLLREAGITLNPQPEHYGDSLALGSADVTLLALTNAYRMLANGGEASPVRWEPAGAGMTRRRVLDAASTWLVTDILADNAARASTFGFDSVLATPIWTAVKTGTSKDMRDNWCIGYSERYTVGVWVGNASGAPMRNVSGVSGAAPAWADIMQALHRGLLSRPAPEGGLVTIRQPSSSGKPQIVAPQGASLVAWDPDIPAHAQGVLARYVGEVADAQWVLNEDVLGGGTQRIVPLRAGHNRLVLRAPAGDTLDEVAYEVRGMPSNAGHAADDGGSR
jgi:penicillin-binding protein 1C